MSLKSLSLVALTAILFTTSIDAGPKDSNGKDAKKDKTHAAAKGCPPGLAKKGNGCTPPGHAKKADKAGIGVDRADAVVGWHKPGDRVSDDYVEVLDPSTHKWPQNAITARHGDFLYLIDRDSGQVLDRLGHRQDWDWQWDDVDFAGCPPGLAKKNPPCIPPGLAKKMPADDRYRVGDRLPDDRIVMFDPRFAPDDTRSIYVRQGDALYRVDRETGLVLDLIGSIADLLQ